jgi:hypothetical protein
VPLARRCSYLPAAYRRFVSIGSCLYQKLLDLPWQKLNILREKAKFNFKIIVTGQGSIFILYGLNVRDSIHKKGNYHHDLAEL